MGQLNELLFQVMAGGQMPHALNNSPWRPAISFCYQVIRNIARGTLINSSCPSPIIVEGRLRRLSSYLKHRDFRSGLGFLRRSRPYIPDIVYRMRPCMRTTCVHGIVCGNGNNGINQASPRIAVVNKLMPARHPLSLLVAGFVIMATSFLCWANNAHAGSPPAVIYPVYHNDADKIISEIRRGIRASQEGNIQEIGINPSIENSIVQKKIKSFSEKTTVITITSDLGDLVRASGFKGQLIEGISTSFTNKLSTVSVGVESSPQAYVESLRKLRPGAGKIFYFTLINENINEEETGRPHGAGGDKQINIEYVSVRNINDAMQKINDAINNGDPTRDALWIPDRVLSMSNSTVIRYVLSESWRKSFIVLTDSLDAVVRGLLFSLIPDYFAYGEYLGKLSLDLAARDDFPVSDSIQYFDDAYLMINQRFSVHIGLSINRSLLGKHKIVVPVK